MNDCSLIGGALMFIAKSFREIDKSGVKLGEGVKAIHQVKLNVYSFYVDGVLIDCGAHSLRKQFQTFFEPLDIERVVITHAHEDHVGCAKYLSDKGIPIYMDPLNIEETAQKAKYPIYRKIFWGIRPPIKALPIEETFESKKYQWHTIATPGHAADHVAYLNTSTGQLFSGDLFVTPRTKLILREENIPQLIRSIEKVMSYDFEEMFCCHAGYIKDGKRAFQMKLDYLNELTYKVKSLAKEGKDVDEIKKILFPRHYQLETVSRGEWHSKNIITSILSEL